MALSNGTYYISNSQITTPISLQFATGGTGTNLTVLQSSGAKSQQWEIFSSTQTNSYTFRNLDTQEYASWSGTLPPPDNNLFVVSDPAAMPWYIQQGIGGYVVSPDTTFNYSWNIRNGYSDDNTPIILWPFTNVSSSWNELWNFTLIQAATATAPSSTSGNKTGVIAGASAGGVVGGVALLVLAFLQAHHLWYILSSLGFNLFGWWLFGRRRFIFFADKDLGQVEISLFLSTQETVSDSSDGSLLVWQVFKIGHSRRGFTVSCPCIPGSSGHPRLGFGTVIDHPNWVESNFFEEAPAAWNGDEWTKLEAEGEKPVFRNDGTFQTDVALGTYDVLKGGTAFKPFLRLNNIAQNETREAETNLYMHAFVTHGYENGQYGESLVGDVIKDALTVRGIKLTDLKPLTHWNITKVNERFRLKVKGKKEESNA